MGKLSQLSRPVTRFVAGTAFFLSAIGAVAQPVVVQGPASLTKGLSTLSATFRDAGVETRVETAGGSTTAITALGQQDVNIAVLSRGLTAQEKSRFPTRRFFEVIIAGQAYVPAVARNVWEGGVKTITKEQMQKIFEGKITNWRELGGKDGEIKYFNPEPGSPAYDLLTTWLYEDPRRAPASPGEVIRGDGKTVRDSVEFTRDSISVVPPTFADGKEVVALGIADASGKVVEALEDNLLDRSYPMGRPTFLIFGDRPSGKVKDFLDLLRSPEGRAILVSADLTPVTPKDL